MTEFNEAVVLPDLSEIDTETLLENLHAHRQTESAMKNWMNQLLENVKATALYATAENAAIVSRAQCDIIRDELERRAIESFAHTGEKTFHPAVKIVILKVAEITDPYHAKKWAYDFAPRYLSLDETGLKRHAVKVMDTVPLPFVTITEEPSARISQDLSRFGYNQVASLVFSPDPTAFPANELREFENDEKHE